MFSAKNGRLDATYQLIRKGAHINVVNESQCTALLLGSYSGKFECVSLLLQVRDDCALVGCQKRIQGHCARAERTRFGDIV